MTDERECDLACCGTGDGCCECGLSDEEVAEQRARQKRNREEYVRNGGTLFVPSSVVPRRGDIEDL